MAAVALAPHARGVRVVAQVLEAREAPVWLPQTRSGALLFHCCGEESSATLGAWRGHRRDVLSSNRLGGRERPSARFRTATHSTSLLAKEIFCRPQTWIKWVFFRDAGACPEEETGFFLHPRAFSQPRAFCYSNALSFSRTLFVAAARFLTAARAAFRPGDLRPGD